MPHRDRSRYHDLQDIKNAAKNLPLAVVEDAKSFYSKFASKKLTRGSVRTGIKANCVLAACKLANFPRTTKEVADAFGIPTNDISRTYNLFSEVVFDLQLRNETLYKGIMDAKDLKQPYEGPSTFETKANKVTITRPADVLPRLLNDFVSIVEPNKFKTLKQACMEKARRLETCVRSMIPSITILCNNFLLCTRWLSWAKHRPRLPCPS